jgi:outer membrane protein assembly factor BamA
MHLTKWRLVASTVFSCYALAAQPLVQSVTVAGTGLEVKLGTQVGRPFDTRIVEQDVRYLWNLDRFDDIRVETAEGTDHDIAVVFRTSPRQFFTIRSVRIEPNSFGLTSTLPEGVRIDRRRAHELAMDARKQLQERGFPDARVTYELTSAMGDTVDLKLQIDPGDAVRVSGVEFTGALSSEELQHALHALRPRRILPGWRILPSYTQSAVDADVARLRSHYFFKGYFDADAQAGTIETAGGNARVTIDIHEGPQYRAIPLGFCPALFAERRAAEREGVLDFSATVNVDRSGQLTSSTARGQQYRVGRIEFSGNHSYSDVFVLRNLVIDEAQLFDERKLRQSVARLNGAGVFENLDERRVAIVRHPETGVADIHIHLTERKRGSWRISGPIGPASFAGPLQGSIGMRLWTYTASVSALAFAPPLLPILAARTSRLWLPVVSLQRPYMPGEGWRSGFAIAPQLGWRLMGARYLATQLEQRLLPILNGNHGLEPELAITVHRPSSDTTVVCEPAGSKFALLRRVTGTALHSLVSLSGL